jgi:diguanylate cyclase (GGDEF)-like protein
MPESLISKLKKSSRLPSPPGTALQILQLSQEEDVSLQRLSETISADPALSLRLLRYANSAMFGVNKQVSTVRDAVVLLGIRSVRLIALTFSLITQDDDRVCPAFDYGRFWIHSVACGVTARHLAKSKQNIRAEEAFAAGLLSQIGRMVFAVGMPNEYAAILEACGGQFGATLEREMATFKSTYPLIGGDLIAEWGIPRRLAEVVRNQFTPENLQESAELSEFAALIGTAVRVANILCETVPASELAEYKGLLAFSPFFDKQVPVDEALAPIKKELDELTAMLDLKSGTAANAKEIQAKAGEVLGEMSLAAQLRMDAVEKENRGLAEKAAKDGLTGVSNRAAFDERLAQIWKEAVQSRRPLAVILVDVDHFKKFNDTHGHQTGDAVLKSVSTCLQHAVRPVDFVARYGGEEFVIILPRADRLIVAQTCVKLRKSVESTPTEHENQRLSVTISVGAALLDQPSDRFKPQQLVEAADKQLYVSKSKGRNCCSMRQLDGEPQSQPVAAAVQ